MCSWTSSLVSLLFCLLPPLVRLGPAVVLFSLPGGEAESLTREKEVFLSRTDRKGAGSFRAGEVRAGGKWVPAEAGP